VTFRGYAATLAVCADQVQAGKQSTQDALESCVAWIAAVRDRQSVVHLIGNGGSAAVVSHAQNDLVKGCKVQALVHQDIPAMTAYTNDYGYGESYSGPLEVWRRRTDIVIAVSSGGESLNIVQAASAAKRQGSHVITLSGFAPTNALRQLGHANFYVPSSDYGCVELTHAALLHYLTDRLASA
jgi:D-sedoheptulose 7-phosphate isomerase